MQFLTFNILLLFYFVGNIFCRNIKYISTPIIFNNMTKQELIRNFEKYKYYDTIQIKYVNITAIDNNLFKYIRYYLKKLTIQNCNIMSIDKHSFDNFERLCYLFITNNNLETFNGECLPPLNDLEKLDLSNNNIQQFNVSLNSHTLKTLILNYNNLTSLRKNNFYIKCQYLRTLIIQNSRITYIEPGILHNLSKLLLLDLRNNYLSSIESNTFLGLIKLDDLILINSSIEEIKYNAFNGLLQLKKLNLQNNFINQISKDYFTESMSLEKLDLSLNAIEILNQNIFINLPKLLYLNLSNNIISEMPCKVFNKINIISKLDLSKNGIRDISICAFESLNQLTNLNLQQNNLTRLQIGTFSGLRSLVNLDLSHNKLSSLEEAVIHPLENLQIIDISGNQFENLDPVSLLENLESLHKIDISDNKWDCYNLTSVVKYLKSQNINYESRLINFEKKNIDGIQCYYTNNKIYHFDNIPEIKSVNLSDKLLQEKYFSQIIIHELQKIRNNTSSGSIEKNIQQISTNLQVFLNLTTNNINSILSKLKNENVQENLKNIEVQKLTNPMCDSIQNDQNLNIIAEGLEKLNYRIHIFVMAFILLVCFLICCCSFKLYKKTHTSNTKNEKK